MKRKHLFHRLLAGALSASVVLSGIPMQLTAAEEIVGAVTVDEAYEAEELSFDAEQPADDAEEVFYEAEETFFDEEAPEDTVIDFAEEEIAADFDAEQDLALEEQFYEEEAFEAAAPEETDGEEAFALDELIEDPEGEAETTETAEESETSEKDLDGEEAEEMARLLAETLPVSFFNNAQPLTLNTDYTVNIHDKGDYALYKFVPAETAFYNFTSTFPGSDEDSEDNLDPIIIVYNANGESIADDDDSSIGLNFSLDVKLNANTTYYLRAAAYDDNSGISYTFKATKLAGWLKVDVKNFEHKLNPGNSGITLQAPAVDASPAPSYAWYRDYVDEANRISGANGTTYATGPVNLHTDYYLVVTNSFGSETIEYNVGIVNTLSVDYAPGSSSITNTNPGKTIELGVVASGSTGYTYKWYIDYDLAEEYEYNDIIVNGSTASDKLSLTFNQDTSPYIKCYVQDAYGNTQSIEFNVYCQVFFLEYESEIDLKAGDNYTMSVNVTGLSEGLVPSYQWYDEDYEPMPGDANAPNKCTLQNIQTSGQYHCSVSVGGSSRTAYFYINLTNLKSVQAVGDDEPSIHLNESTVLQVAAEALEPGKLTYSWSLYNGDEEEYETIAGAASASLTVGPFTTTGEREYRCRVADQYDNSRSVYFYVYVSDGQPDSTFALSYTGNINVILHGTATMKVTPTGTFKAPITYRWYLKPDNITSYIKIVGQTTDTYVITDVLEEQQYQCEATDADGKIAVANFNLTINTEHTHNWRAGAVTKAATCTAAGTQIYTCTICDATKTQTLPALGHSWGAWVTTSSATVNAAQVQTRTCSRCKQKETRSVGSKLTPAPPKPTPTMTLNVSGTLPMKKKQSAKVVKVSGLIAGDAIKSVTSSNPKLVKVSQKNGTLTLKAQKKTGTATITITLASGLKKSFKVKVQKGKVKTKKITVASKNVSLNKKKSFNLATVLYPLTTQQKATYKTSNKKVATVSKKGVIKAKKKGKAKITVKSGSKKVTVKVTVK